MDARPLLLLQHFQRLAATHQPAPVFVNGQVDGGAIEKGPWLLDGVLPRPLQHPQIGVVGDVGSQMTIAQRRRQVLHQFPVVRIHHQFPALPPKYFLEPVKM
ncbi:hypothetical protein D3C78_1391790 [compost metagenome]